MRRVERDDLAGDEPIEEHRMEARCCLTAGLECFVIKSSSGSGDGALEACRGGFVHFAHTSSSDRGQDLVRAEFIACCQGHLVESVQFIRSGGSQVLGHGLLGSYARRSTRHCLREDLVHLLPYLLTARWLQIPHSGLHVRMTEPLLYGAQIDTSP